MKLYMHVENRRHTLKLYPAEQCFCFLNKTYLFWLTLIQYAFLQIMIVHNFQGLAHTKPLLLITVVLLQAPFMTQVYIRQSEERRNDKQ